MDDEPAQWLGVVQTATGVDLTTLDTVDEFRAACEGEGGVYVPADSPSFPAGAAVADAVAPLNAQIDELTNRPLDVVLQAQRQRDHVVTMVSGRFDEGVTIRLRISQALADRLGIGRTLDSLTRNFGDKGAVLATLTPGNRAANAIGELGRAVDVVVTATSEGVTETITGKLRT